jgi:CubicO group peptidase (beta-lactamase class C family)
MRSRLEGLLGKRKVPGAIVVRVTEKGANGVETFSLADCASGTPVGTQTRFHLYSGTKVFTACAIMRLIEQGKLDLDADCRELLPQAQFRHPLTIRQLVSHTSGLPESLRAFLAVHFPGEHQPTTGEALSQYRLDKGRPAGGKATYRNVNFAILGELVSQLSGMTFQEYVDRHLLRPWSSSANFSASEEPMATGYAGRFSLMRLLARPLLGAHGSRVFDKPIGRYVSLRPFNLNTVAIGGLIGSALDFAPMVAEFLSADNGVLQAETRAQMLQQISSGAAGIASKVGVGIGWKLGDVDGVRFWNHEGGGPGFCTEMRIYPDEGVGFVIMMNYSHSRRLSWLCHDICELLRKQDGAR